MDERLEKALEFSNYMVTLNNQKRMLTEKYYQNLIHYYKGGQFSVNQGLISFCQTLISNDQDDAVLIDDNNTPILIDNIEDFTLEILNVYFTASNEYLSEFDTLKSSRTVEKLVNE
jgi:hypothetical protein